MNILAGEWGRAMRTGRPLSVLLIDLDLFHDYNELHGHSGGDACLRRVAGLLAEALRRPSDLLGRYGGEEFVAVLPDTDAGGALRVAERLCGEVAKLGLPHEGSSHGVVTTSIGVATGHAHRQVGPEGLLAEADQAMYLAKREGRNRVYPREAPPRPQRFRRRAATGSDRWPSPVWMDPVYADRLPGELARMQRAARRAVKAAELGYLTLVRQLARRLETIARDFQFASVVAMARSLEAAAGRADDVGAQAQSEELRWYLERVPVVYRSRTAEIERLPRVT
jgi:diguanylate cyclase (GGDEF)-like protein